MLSYYILLSSCLIVVSSLHRNINLYHIKNSVKTTTNFRNSQSIHRHIYCKANKCVLLISNTSVYYWLLIITNGLYITKFMHGRKYILSTNTSVRYIAVSSGYGHYLRDHIFSKDETKLPTSLTITA